MCTMHIHLDWSQTGRQTYVQAAANNYMHHGLACLPLITALSCCQLVASVGKHNVLFIAKVVWCILFSFFWQMRELRHDNINPFIGACIDSPSILIVTAYCAKGSLQVKMLRNCISP